MEFNRICVIFFPIAPGTGEAILALLWEIKLPISQSRTQTVKLFQDPFYNDSACKSRTGAFQS